MLKGFREFILRGNVIDLAIAFVIGAAFTAIVNAIVASVINPLIGALFSAKSLATALPVLIPTVSGGKDAVLYFGAVIAAIIQFLLIAVVVYFGLVVPINFIKKQAFQRKEAGEEPPADTPPTDLELLTEIRDLLAAGATSTTEHGKHIS